MPILLIRKVVALPTFCAQAEEVVHIWKMNSWKFLGPLAASTDLISLAGDTNHKKSIHPVPKNGRNQAVFVVFSIGRRDEW